MKRMLLVTFSLLLVPALSFAQVSRPMWTLSISEDPVNKETSSAEQTFSDATELTVAYKTKAGDAITCKLLPLMAEHISGTLTAFNRPVWCLFPGSKNKVGTKIEYLGNAEPTLISFFYIKDSKNADIRVALSRHGD